MSAKDDARESEGDTEPFVAPQGMRNMRDAARGAEEAADVESLNAALPTPRYHATAKLGAGGMGSVYKATERGEIDRPVAIKTINLGMNSKELIARFDAERQALATMQHDGIAAIFDAGILRDGRPFFVMELVNGRPITAFADEHQLTIDERLRLFQQACHAVTHAHRRGIIHRDLKSGNVLAFMQDGRPRVKVIDFGIAKAKGPGLTDHTLRSRLDAPIGTWTYMSPEQAAGNLDIDFGTDVYALGVLLYELLAGAAPFDFAKEAEERIKQAIREQDPPKPSTRLSSLGPESAHAAKRRGEELTALLKRLGGELSWIPLKALKKQPRERYPDPAALAADIDNYLAGTALVAGPDSVAYRLRKFLARHAAPVAAAAVILLLLVAGIVGTSIGMLQARKSAARAKQATEYAERQRNIADEQRGIAVGQKELAQARFNDVRELANTFLFAFHDKIESLVGATPARQMLVLTAQRYLNKLSAGADGEGKLLRDVFVALIKVGDIQRDLGDTQGAMESHLKALTITQKLADADPLNANAQRDLSIVHNKVGDMLTAYGDTKAAMESYRKSLVIVQALADADPLSAQAQRDLAISHEKVGDVLAASGDTRAAMQSYRKFLAITQKLADADPLNAEAQRDLCLSHGKIGDMLAASGDAKAAMESYHKLLAIVQKLADADPLNVETQRELSRRHARIGDMLAASGDAEGAMESYRKFLAIARKLADADPLNATAQHNLAAGHQRIGDALAASGDTRGAMESYSTFLAVVQKLADADPLNAQAQRGLVVGHAKIGDLLNASGDAKEAMESYRKLQAIAQKLADADPLNAQAQRDLSINHQRIGDMLKSSGDAEAAMENYRKSLAIAQKLADADPLNADAQRGLSVIHYRIGMAEAALSKAPASIEARQKRLRAAVEEYRLALDLHMRMKQRGALQAGDAPVEEMLTRLIAEAKSEAAALNGGAPP